MPEHPPTLIHFTTDALLKAGRAACGQDHRTNQVSARPGDVTCFACRKSSPFLVRQGVEPPTPLREVIEKDPALNTLAGQAITAAAKNHRGMYVIEEVIHMGDYRSTRYVEVYAINAVTMDAILQSSAFSYGSWLNPDNPDHKPARNVKLHQLVEDLKHGRTNRSIGWSTFRLITEH
jgi:hypothetical protein